MHYIPTARRDLRAARRIRVLYRAYDAAIVRHKGS